MRKEMRMVYDEEGDILDVSIGIPMEAISREVEGDFFIRIAPATGEVVGFSIINFKKWFRDSKDVKVLPITGELALS
jgi:uncharacterized protein YuzE